MEETPTDEEIKNIIKKTLTRSVDREDSIVAAIWTLAFETRLRGKDMIAASRNRKQAIKEQREDKESFKRIMKQVAFDLIDEGIKEKKMKEKFEKSKPKALRGIKTNMD